MTPTPSVDGAEGSRGAVRRLGVGSAVTDSPPL